ncbi:hypothetical protein PsorP6_013309 [Peronosclerospora sorghi]|uniref:Uncharacterized protein n=1 Tax=Peronosclerospora sorghi TaxID=230839 RepID=A0ACC0WJG1_9STRA|nr:hypothetical protein PsorP6_013309 [Peronosclerospora sorghi]
MGNEGSRPSDTLSPSHSGVMPRRSPYTPTGSASRRAQSFNTRALSPSSGNPLPLQRQPIRSLDQGATMKKERTIQRMDQAIRRRVRGGITYNMKVLIRGAKGTGKTSLFQRLKGDLIPETHDSTPQLQSATINWSFRQNLEEKVKCEVWDVVDQGFDPLEGENDGEQEATNAANALRKGKKREGLSANVLTTAAAGGNPTGIHSMAIVDASTVDVYHEAHGVIFLLDITKWDTFEYVKKQLDSVPVHIPTLVLGNFRDRGAQRKIFKEDIQELLYGVSNRTKQVPWRRPRELMYLECSLLNCYGLKALHRYFGIPFLQLKMATIRQQMRILEGEFALLKHDVEATITEQRYAEYVEHIRVTGLDIRTGRRSSASRDTTSAMSRSNSVVISPREISQQTHATEPNKHVTQIKESSPKKSPTIVAYAEETSQAKLEVTKVQDNEDLPAKNSSTEILPALPLKLKHKESKTSSYNGVAHDNQLKTEEKSTLPEGQSNKLNEPEGAGLSCSRKSSMEEMIYLEDFQVPKIRTSDLDQFYSENESEQDVGEHDDDFVVARVDEAINSSGYHKQRFLDSDSSDSDDTETSKTQRQRKKKVSDKVCSDYKYANVSKDQAEPHLPNPPTTVPQFNHNASPNSLAQSFSSNSTKNSQDAPHEVSLKQQVSWTLVIDKTIDSMPLTTCASASASSSLRSKSESSSAETKQDGSDLVPPEMTGTEDLISVVGQVNRERSILVDAESVAKDSKDDTVNNSTGTSDATGYEEPNSVQNNGACSKPDEPVPSFAHETDDSFNEESDLESPDKKGNPQDWGSSLTHSDREKKDCSDAAGAQASEKKTLEVAATNFVQRRAKIIISKDDSVDGVNNERGDAKMSRSSLVESCPLPESSVSFCASPVPEDIKPTTGPLLEEIMEHPCSQNIHEADDGLSLTSSHFRKTELPLLSHQETPIGSSSCSNESKRNASIHLSDPQTSNSKESESTSVVPDFASDFDNDLEAFLNESNSESEDLLPLDQTGCGKDGMTAKDAHSGDDDDDDGESDQNRFATYNISKKKRSERRRQQKEDIRRLTAALDVKYEPPPSSTRTVAEASSEVMEAIRKAQEEAMRMLPADAAPILAPSSSKKQNHKKPHKQNNAKKSNQPSRSKNRRL